MQTNLFESGGFAVGLRARTKAPPVPGWVMKKYFMFLPALVFLAGDPGSGLALALDAPETAPAQIRTPGAESDGAAPERRDKAGPPETGGKYVTMEEYNKLKDELGGSPGSGPGEPPNRAAPPQGEPAAAPGNGERSPSPSAAAGAWSIPPKVTGRRNPVPADAQSIARGRDHYTAECLVCHGPAGKGDGPKAGIVRTQRERFVQSGN